VRTATAVIKRELLEQHHPATTPRQLPGGTGAHDPGADNDNVESTLHSRIVPGRVDDWSDELDSARQRKAYYWGRSKRPEIAGGMRVPTPGLDRQFALYMGTDPLVSPEEWEQRARDTLESGPFHYIAGGAGGEETMRANRAAFLRYRLRPRMLRDVSDRNVGIELFGTALPAPFILAPLGVQSIIHQDAERAPARAAAAAGIPFTLSTVSSVSIEETAKVMGNAARWFQLYPGKDREIVASFVHRAERAGYSALVVTLDTTMLGWRERDLRERYLPFLAGEGLANFLSDPVFRSHLPVPPEAHPAAAIRHFFEVYVNPAFSWPDLDFVRSLTRLPLLIKGILHPDDAREALGHGVDGIVVSNHGGRQVDGAVASLDALVDIAEVVDGRVPLLLDSGIRRGADILKALALGASAVLLGRPYAYALAADGEQGVRACIENLVAEFDLQLALCGCRSPAEVERGLVVMNRRSVAVSTRISSERHRSQG
jgi:lactate 2-monooxygenase